MTYAGFQSADDAKSVVLLHPHTLVREGVARILQEAGFHVAGLADTGPSLHQLVAQHNPDIILLLDWEISEVDPTSVRELTEKFPRASVVILTRPRLSESFLPAMQAGATGCLSVNLSSHEFVQALLLLAKGDIIISQEMANGVKGELATEQAPQSRDDISGREREVLCLVSRGATNREIAERLIVSEHTVKVHLRNILNKLNLRNRQQIAAYAVREGLAVNTESEDRPEFSP